MSDQEKDQETVESPEVEGHLSRFGAEGTERLTGPEAERLIQRSDENDETPDVEGHLSLRNGPERFLDAEKSA
jgi:hypothetical protein